MFTEDDKINWSLLCPISVSQALNAGPPFNSRHAVLLVIYAGDEQSAVTRVYVEKQLKSEIAFSVYQAANSST